VILGKEAQWDAPFCYQFGNQTYTVSAYSSGECGSSKEPGCCKESGCNEEPGCSEESSCSGELGPAWDGDSDLAVMEYAVVPVRNPCL
jgi:hypothetical protein